MSPNVRAVYLAGALAGAGAVGLALVSLTPTRLLGGNFELVLGFVVFAFSVFALPGLALLGFINSNNSQVNLYALLAAPLLSFVFYWLIFRGVLFLDSFIKPNRKQL
jgi:hypothetical protein